MWFTITFAAVIAISLISTWWLFRWRESTHQAAAMFQAILTGSAIIIAGYWYLVERRGTPHADISQTVTIIPAENGFAFVEAAITLRNLGSVLVKVEQIDIRLQRASPTGLDLVQVDKTAYDEWPATFKDETPMFDKAELQWPTIKLFERKVLYEIEPGESDVVTATFIVPCVLKEVRVASQVQKDVVANLWWKARTFASLIEACGSMGTAKKGKDG